MGDAPMAVFRDIRAPPVPSTLQSLGLGEAWQGINQYTSDRILRNYTLDRILSNHTLDTKDKKAQSVEKT